MISEPHPVGSGDIRRGSVPRTFFTGQPKLMSITSNPASTNSARTGRKLFRFGAHQLAAHRMFLVHDLQKVAGSVADALSRPPETGRASLRTTCSGRPDAGR